jgi:hypothetical protein
MDSSSFLGTPCITHIGLIPIYSITIEHFSLRQKMTLTTKIYCSRSRDCTLYIITTIMKSGFCKNSYTRNNRFLRFHL